MSEMVRDREMGMFDDQLAPWLVRCDCGETTYEKGQPCPCVCAEPAEGTAA